MIKTVILDFGGVLAYPISGNWFIPYDLFKIAGFGNAVKLFFRKKKLNGAFIKGNEYLSENHKLTSEDEEYEQFCQFYRIVFRELKLGDDGKKIMKLAHSKVFDDYQLHVYDDAADGIRELKQKYRVMILSDTWPSTKRILKNNGILELLDGLILSCDYNETKAGGKLFETAVSELNLVPGECVFVDDSRKNLENAEKTGFHPVLMDRRNEAAETAYPVVHCLADIEGIAAEIK